MTHAGYQVGDREGALWAKAFCSADRFEREDRIAINGFYESVDCKKCLAIVAEMEAIK